MTRSHARFRPWLVLAALSISALGGCVVSSSTPPAPVEHAPAVLVPLMKEPPTLDERIDAEEWADAGLITGEFVIADGTRAAGRYGFSARIGATAEGLHLALQVPDLPPNPWNSDHATHSDCVIVFFTGDDGAIASPSFSIGACASLSGYSTAHPGYWSGGDWRVDDDPESGPFNHGRPTGGTWAFGNVLNGTLFFEVYTMRFPQETSENGLRLEAGSAFRMAMVFMRTAAGEEGADSPDARGPFFGPHDAFPGDGYTPHAHYDPSGWIRLRMAS